MDFLVRGLLAGLATGLSTLAGALPILREKSQIQNRWSWLHLNLDFAIGMMLAAAAFNLIAPAFESQSKHLTGFLSVFLCLVLGVGFIYVMGKQIADRSETRGHTHTQTKAWLFVSAMMLHNLPEGLAAGAALSSPALLHGGAWTVLGAIMLQNVPEGFATAVAFLSLGMNRRKAFAGAALTGAVELGGGALGGVFSSLVQNSLPYILAFAGGAMISVTLDEIATQIRNSSFSYLFRKQFLLGAFSVLLMNWLVG